MHIDSENRTLGNRAMASVLLLYYHLIHEGGFTNDQMVYVDRQEFDVFSYVDVVVSPEQQYEIDQRLLRRGAAIGLLCELTRCRSTTGTTTRPTVHAEGSRGSRTGRCP